MDIIVTSENLQATTGTLSIGDFSCPCTLGANGKIIASKMQEGGKRTPIGEFPLLYVFWRADKYPKPECKLEVKEITQDMGWCDEPEHLEYNKLVKLPFTASHENMYRDDYLYDYVVVIDYNINPTIVYKGSAIFLHIAREAFTPTAGCVGVSKESMLEILKLIDKDSKIIIK